MSEALSTVHSSNELGTPLSARIQLPRSPLLASGVQGRGWQNLIWEVLDSAKKIDKFGQRLKLTKLAPVSFIRAKLLTTASRRRARQAHKAIIYTRRVRSEHHPTLCKGCDCIEAYSGRSRSTEARTDKITWPTVSLKWFISPSSDTGSNLSEGPAESRNISY